MDASHTATAGAAGTGRAPLTNWAGNQVFTPAEVVEPASVEELQEIVARSVRVRALGSRHSFTDLGDSVGTLVGVAGLPPTVDVDTAAGTARVAAGMRYGEVAPVLHRAGVALPALASLPHISVAGAVATGTHGSGDTHGSLATSVSGVELVGPDGALHVVRRGDPSFDGSVVALGALGVVTHLTLDLEPTYEVRQDLWTDLPWDDAVEHLDDLTTAASSVSLFTGWDSPVVEQVWLKSRGTTTRDSLWGAVPATGPLHMIPGCDPVATTEQGGRPGPWHERLPHFRLSFTPSAGDELQSEYLVPRVHALTAVERLRGLAGGFAPLLQVAEIRTVAADRLWLSSAYGTDVVAFHFTWLRDPEGVRTALGPIEEALLPLGARPHWGKVFLAEVDELRRAYPRLEDFRRLALTQDPSGKHRNDFLARTLGLPLT